MKWISMSLSAVSVSMLIVCLLFGMAASAEAQDLIHSRNRVQPNVPPIDELEILDPRVDHEGKPQSQIVVGANGVTKVEIPPTVIVHRYYYTGDRDFQGPMLQGGPTLLAVNDPATGEQIYAEAVLPPGAPRITYRRDRIVYEYRDRSIIVCFGNSFPLGLGTIGKPSVSISHHSPALRTVARKAELQRESHREWWVRTGVPEVCTIAVESSKSVANSTADTVKKAGTFVTAPVKAVWKATPLSSLIPCQEKQPAYEPSNLK